MINKQNLWFATLFSLILILGIYYLNINDEVSAVLKQEKENLNENVIEITDSDVLVSLEVENDEEKQALLAEYQDVLLNTQSTLEEKNNAYENIQILNNNKSDEEKIKKIIKDNFNINSFIKIKNNTISIVANEKNHSNELANDIIRKVQEQYTEKKYITVKFNTK